ncbi:hypothetical protein L208DRAFT_1426082 [Tricholoma matsutake]|nr:hypothetical protein L208DRAFT_1426082 [Tricholoma matsutake 945]
MGNDTIPPLLPADRKSNITPKEHIFDIEAIDKEIEKELKSLCEVIETFLKNPEPSTWVPPNYVTPSNREYLTNLRIPSYRNGQPSLLLHNLDVCDGNEIEEMFGHGEHLCICNTSGSGKTRRIMEGLTKYWGFYLVAIPDANGVGIRDLQDALEDIADWEWTSDLSSLPSGQRVRQNDLNSLIASKHLRKVLAARVVIFQLFLRLAIVVDGKLQEKHKRIWLLFQLSDQLPRGGILHPFVHIIKKCLRRASNEALVTLIERLTGIREKYLSQSHFSVMLDEAQWATRLYPRSFISSTSDRVYQSIVREIVKVITRSRMTLVVSGTDLSLAELEEAMASGVSKPAVILAHRLGMFDTWPKLKPFLERYIPASILETPSGYRLQMRIREYLLGRYRFSVSFLELFLTNGLESPHRLLNEYIKEHTACLPGDTGDPFTSSEPELHFEVQVMSFGWDRLKLDSTALQEAAQIVQSHLTKGKSPTFGPVTARLVEYGIARLRNHHEGQIVEPLAFLSLMKWLQTLDHANLEANIQSRLAFQASRGDGYEELVVLYLLRTLRYPVPLSTIFNFHNRPIVGCLDEIDVAVDVLGGAPQNPGLGVVHYAADIEDVICWLETPAIAPAVLITTHLFGPDVIIRCSSPLSNLTVASRNILAMGQFKSYTGGNKESLVTGTITEALTSLNRVHWFKQTPLHQRQKLIDAIEKYCVLCFVGGYPLPPNLNLSGISVSQAIDALGPNIALASINLDLFKAHFISEDEARNVLAPLEHALTHKQKINEIDS